MSDKQIPEIVHRLLHDNSFVMWCMVPTRELDIKWHAWIKEHPENQRAIDEARLILRSVRLNEYSIPDEKSEQIWLRLQNEMQQKRFKKRNLFMRYAAACAVFVTVSLAGYWLMDRGLYSGNNLMTGIGMAIDTVHTEVTLITKDHKVINVEDNTLISFNSDVTMKNSPDEELVVKKIEAEGIEKNIDETVMNTLVVPKGRRSSLLLADGSKIWINSGSVLRFPSRFEGDDRTIEAEGEIYIEVVKSGKPFHVKTASFTVNVLGTKFNLSAYGDEQAQSVVLVEGSVMVDTKEEENIQLTPNHKLTLQPDKHEINEVDVLDYISWKDGVLIFKGETMENILMRLSRYYNVQIECAPGIAQRTSSGKLVLFDNIEQVMETFSMLYNVHYRFESNTLLIE